MINIFRIPISKDTLRELSEKERSLLFLLGYAANQIIFLTKLTFFSTNKINNNTPLEQTLYFSQSQILARIIFGILHEIWVNLITNRFIKNREISEKYNHILGLEDLEILEELKKHFGKSSLLSYLRNNYSFHYPKNEEIEAIYQKISNNDEWDDYWNLFLAEESPYNSFYMMSDLIILHGTHNVTDKNDFIAAQQEIMEEVRKVAPLMLKFIGALTASMLRKDYFNNEIIKIDNAPEAKDIFIPFYIETNEIEKI